MTETWKKKKEVPKREQTSRSETVGYRFPTYGVCAYKVHCSAVLRLKSPNFVLCTYLTAQEHFVQQIWSVYPVFETVCLSDNLYWANRVSNVHKTSMMCLGRHFCFVSKQTTLDNRDGQNKKIRVKISKIVYFSSVPWAQRPCSIDYSMRVCKLHTRSSVWIVRWNHAGAYSVTVARRTGLLFLLRTWQVSWRPLRNSHVVARLGREQPLDCYTRSARRGIMLSAVVNNRLKR